MTVHPIIKIVARCHWCGDVETTRPTSYSEPRAERVTVVVDLCKMRFVTVDNLGEVLLCPSCCDIKADLEAAKAAFFKAASFLGKKGEEGD